MKKFKIQIPDSGGITKRKNKLVYTMDQLHKPKAFKSRKNLLNAKDADKELKDFLEDQL